MSVRKKLLRRREPQNLEYQKKKLKIVLIVLAVFSVVLLMVLNIGSIELPLPENEQGTKVTQGRIVSCEIQKIGTGLTAQLYVGIQLSSIKTRLLKVNASLSSRDTFQSICDKKIRIKVTYHAGRLLLRPGIRYTVDVIEQSGARPLPLNEPLYNRDEYESKDNKLMDRELIFLLPVILVLFLVGRRNERKKGKSRRNNKGSE